MTDGHKGTTARRRTRRAPGASERGASLVFLGVSLVALLAVMALAIDLGMLYVGRSEAQRAADAAALAGAYRFSQSSCTSPGGDCSADTYTKDAARQQAQHVADTNYVLSQQVNVASSDVKFTFPQVTEPQVTVTVRRNNIPLIFARVFGKRLGDVSAVATAEATQAGGVGCVVPFIMADCNPQPDSVNNTKTWENPACPTSPITGKPAYYFVNPLTGNVDSEVVGHSLLLHTTTSNGGTPVPSQWYLAGLSGGSAGSPSGSLLRSNIEHCSANGISCGSNDVSVPTIPGNKLGPVVQGVNTLIGASGNGPGNGQDILVSVASDGTPSIMPGTGTNPQISNGPDASMVTIPVFSGVNNNPNTTALSPGNQNTVTVVGFAQVFINYVAGPGTYQKLPAPCDNVAGGPFSGSPVCVTVLKVTSCGTGGNGNNVNSASSPVPVQLIQGPG
jgi:hypothetical protein